jgi:Zn-dependent peptidase ImmA (M78 family)
LEPHVAHGAMKLARAARVGVGVYPERVMRGLDSFVFYPRGRDADPEIAMRRGLRPERRAWLIAHELAELELRQARCCAEEIERIANAAAAELLMPTAAFRSAASDDLEIVAAAFGCEQRACAIRMAEVGLVDATVVLLHRKPALSFAKEGFQVPHVSKLRCMPGVRSVNLTDERGEALLIAA